MATIRTAIQLYDGMTPALRSITNAMNIVLNSFESLQTASGNAIDVSSIRAARTELNGAAIVLDEVEQGIRQANEAQQNFNNSMRDSQGAANGLLNKIKNIAATMGVAFSVKKIIGLADEMTQINARLNLMNDGSQDTAELQDKIMASANRSRASYQQTAEMVSKLGMQAGDAFNSNDEIIAFVEQLNKTFVITGTDAMGIQSTMYNLTQALSSGVLRGQDLNAVMSNAKPIIQNIADYLDVPIDKVRDMAAEGEITAEIIKNAMFYFAEETNKTFEDMAMTFSQVGKILGNTLLQAFEPVIQTIGKGAQWIYDNWSTLEPVFWGLAAAVGACAVMTWLSVAANRALIKTMFASPITLIALAIGVLVGFIYKWVQAVGGLEIAWKIAMNGILKAWDWVKIKFFTGIYWILDLWDKLKLGIMLASVGIQNFMGDMKVGVLNILQSMINGAIGIINDFINILNKIPGVSIDAIQEVTFGTTAQMENDAAKKAREADLNIYRNKIKAGMAERDASLAQMKEDARSAAAERQAEINKLKAEKAAKESRDDDYSSIYNNVEEIAGNTAKMANSKEYTEEVLEYMRDLAEQEAINRFTTAEINIEMNNENNISSNMDLDGIVDYLSEGVYEAMEVAAEGGV